MAHAKKEKPMGKRLKDIRTDKKLSLDYLYRERDHHASGCYYFTTFKGLRDR